MKTQLKKNYFTINSYSELLLLVSLVLMIIVSISSCKKEAKVNPTPAVVKNSVTGTIDGKTISIAESGIASTLYSTSGDAVKSLETGATLNAAGDKLNFFINDLKNGALSLEKKTGTSFNPGSRTIQINDNSTGGVQTYVSYLSGGNTYYAYSGQITITVDATTITIKWSISFKDATGRIFTSEGTYTINYATVITKPKSDVKDPTPVASKPTIENIAPTSGKVGDSVSITGVNYSTVLADNVVKFNGAAATVLTATATKLVVKAPTSTTGAISVQVKNSEVTNGPAFTYVQPATFTSFAPTTAKVGDTLTVTGTNFSTTAAENIFKFNGASGAINGAIVTVNTTQLKVIVPQGAVTGVVTLNVKGGATLVSGVPFTLATTTSTGDWSDVGFVTNYISAQTVSASNGTSFVFSGSNGANYLYYTADGTTYSNVYSNLPFDQNRLGLHLLKADGGTYYITTSKGVAKSTDGKTWKKLTPDPLSTDRSFTGISARNGVVLLLSGGELFSSPDAGETWTKTTSPTGSGLEYITADYNSKYVYALKTSNNTLGSTDPKKLYRSTDQGKTWLAAAGTTGLYFFGSNYVDFFEVIQSTPYLLFSPSTTSEDIVNQRLYKASGQGESWTKISDDNVLIIKQFGDYVAYSNGSNLNVSNDVGATFKTYATPDTYKVGGVQIFNGNAYIFTLATKNGASEFKIFKKKL